MGVNSNRISKFLVLVCIISALYICLKYTFDISDYTGFNTYESYAILHYGVSASSQTAAIFRNIQDSVSVLLLNMDLAMVLFFPMYYLSYLIVNYALIRKLTNNNHLATWAIMAIFLIFASAEGIFGGFHTLGYLFIQVSLLSIIIYFTSHKSNYFLLVIAGFMLFIAYLESYNAGAVSLLYIGSLGGILFLIFVFTILKNNGGSTVFSPSELWSRAKALLVTLALSLISSVILVFSDSWVYNTFLGFVNRNGGMDTLESTMSSYLNGDSPQSSVVSPIESPSISEVSEITQPLSPGDLSPVLSFPTIEPIDVISTSFNLSGIVVYLLIAGIILLNILLNLYYLSKTKKIDSQICTFIALFAFVLSWAVFAVIRQYIGQISVGYAVIPGIYSLSMLVGTVYNINRNIFDSPSLRKVMVVLLGILIIIFGSLCFYNIVVDNPEFNDDTPMLPAYIATSDWVYEYTGDDITHYSDIETLGMIGLYHYSIYGVDGLRKSYDLAAINQILSNHPDKPSEGYFLADTFSDTMSFTWENWDKMTLQGMDDIFDSLPQLNKAYSQSDYFKVYYFD